MQLVFIEDGLEVDSPETMQSAGLFVQFDSPDVFEDHFTIFWGGKRLDRPTPLAEFFTNAAQELVSSNEEKPFYRTVLYTDRQKTVARTHSLNLSPPGLEGDIWFARFELLPNTYRLFIRDAPLPRFIAWGRIGDNTDATQDSLGIWMLPADFKTLRTKIFEFITETYPRDLRPGELNESLDTLAQKVGVTE
jgi:hypothetical protein